MTVRAETEVTLTRVNDGDNGVKVYDGTSGSVVTVSNASAYPALELVADIIPIQPNDYDSVWFGGAGKNVCVPFEGTKYGIVRTVNDDGTVSITGTATATSWAYLEEYYDLPYCGIDVGGTISIYSDVYIAVMAYNGTTSLGSKSSKDGVATTYTIPANTTRIRILQYPKSTTPTAGEVFDTTAKYWVSKSAFSSWEPYENICPIYGHDHCNVVVSPTLLDTDGTTYTTNFPQVVYGGTLDVVKGILTVTYDNIASYNGETLNGEWISDRDVYVSGTTPTTGAQVVYELDTPIVYSVSPKDIELITGTCNVWATTGDITDFRYAEISSDTLMVLDKVNADIKQTSQYFWHEQTGAEAGAHITEIPQEEFEANPSGGNLLATSNGIAVRDGLTDKAIYSGDGVILYAENNVVGFQILTTGSTSEQTVMLIVNKKFPANKTTSAVITELATVASSKKIIVRIRDAGNPIYGDTIQFTKGTSATHTSTYSFIVDYDGDQTFSVTNNRSGELTMPDVRYQMTLPTPDIRVRDITLTNGTWYCESKIKLWENPTPNNSWSGDLTSSDIDLSILALCDEVEMYYLFTTSPNYYVMSTRASVMHNGVGDMGSTGYMVVANNTSNRTGGRTFQVNDASGVTISSASYNGSTNNAYAIPWKIVGIKRI